MNKVRLLLIGLPGVSLYAAAALTEGLPSPATLLVPTLIIALLLFLNGVYVAAEFAVNGVRPTQIEELVEEGHRTAPTVQALLESPLRQKNYIATAQLGVTLASLGLGMYGEPQISRFVEPYLAHYLGATTAGRWSGTLGYIIALSLLTYLHVVLGEMIPKSLTLSSTRRAILILIRPMQVTETLFKYVVQGLNAVGMALLKLLRVPPGEEHLHSTQELEQIVAESAQSGLLNPDEEKLILNILTFDERQVHQVMTPRRQIHALEVNTPLPQVVNLITNSRFSRFPVYEGDMDHIIGLLHLKDLIRQQLQPDTTFNMRQLLRPVTAVPEHYPAHQLLGVIKQLRLHMAIVLDEFGGTAGLVTLEDLVEEIIGEVRDEFDKKEQDPLIELGPGALEVSGQYLLDDLQDFITLGPNEELPDVETVGGLIVTLLGRPPQVGDKPAYGPDIKFTVLAVDGLAVARTRVDYPARNNADGDETSL